MGMVIQHNLTAMNSNRQLGMTTGLQARSSEKLSSGYKINRAADDAAGLAISEKMRRQIRGLNQGSENLQDGISMVQVGDGALAEVMDMVHRMTELSVKAANATLTPEDRNHIQQEIDKLLAEINRIEATTTFNEKPLFGAGEVPITNADGTPLIAGSIPYESFSFANVNIDNTPVFNGSDTENYMLLQAKVSDANSAANGTTYRLLFGDGGTSYPSVRLTYEENGVPVTKIANLYPTNNKSDFTTSDYVNNNGTVSRKFTYNKDGVNFEVTQKATPNSNDKNYEISYVVENKCDKELNIEFMFNVDTAYDDKDNVESYYTQGARIDTTRVYKRSGYADNLTGSNVIEGIPDSFSIVNKNEALAFAENIQFTSAAPDLLSIGHWTSVDKWNYYNGTTIPSSDPTGMDLAFSAVWEKKGMSNGDTLEFSLKYGISPTQNDSNINQDEIHMSDKAAVIKQDAKQFWIQASSEYDDGMYISFGKIDLDTLNLRDLNVQTEDNARYSIDRIKGAMGKVSKLRSHLGAQQNRLEHSYANNRNVEENTTAAESRIRDTDMAAEMVKYSNNNILMQAGQSILAQANQTNQGVLALLQ